MFRVCKFLGFLRYFFCFTEILTKYGVDLEGEEFMNLMTKYDLKENDRFCYIDFMWHFILNLKPQEDSVSLLSRRRIHTPKIVVSAELEKQMRWVFDDNLRDNLSRDMTKPTKWLCTQWSLGIRPVWSEPLLCAEWVAKDPSFLHANSEDSDQTGRMPRLIWVFAGCTLTLLVLSCRGSFPFFS